jgi:hypothetical protein
MKPSAKKIALLTTVAVVILLVFADEYPALRFRGDGKFSGGPVFGYEIRLRSIPFYRAGEYAFHFRGIPHEEMSLLLYTEGKKYLYAEYEGSPRDDQHELTHLQTAIEALLVDDRGRTVCQGTGFPLHGDLNGNPNGWILGGGDPAEYYHVNCLRVALKPSESYSLTIRIRDVDPQTPRIDLTPVLQGGQLDLP